MNNTLMQLRKCCNHPYLLDGAEAANAPAAQGGTLKALEAMVAASGKLALIDPMLGKLRTQGHRVLIYSQFTSLLDVLEDWLIGRGWGFQRIDGDVGERASPVQDHGPVSAQFLLTCTWWEAGPNHATSESQLA